MPSAWQILTARSSAPALTLCASKPPNRLRPCCNGFLKSAGDGVADETLPRQYFVFAVRSHRRRHECPARARAGLRRTATDVLGAERNRDRRGRFCDFCLFPSKIDASSKKRGG